MQRTAFEEFRKPLQFWYPVGQSERIASKQREDTVKTISIVTPCYNEEDNVVELYTRVRKERRVYGTDGETGGVYAIRK